MTKSSENTTDQVDETQLIHEETGYPTYVSGSNRPYWAYTLTEFCIAIKVAKEEEEEIPANILEFVQNSWPWVVDSNNETYVTRKLEWHRGTVPGNPGNTGRPRWLQGFRRREELSF